MHIDGDDLVDAVILSEVLADDPPPRPAETPVILTPTVPLPPPPPVPGATAPPEFPGIPWLANLIVLATFAMIVGGVVFMGSCMMEFKRAHDRVKAEEAREQSTW